MALRPIGTEGVIDTLTVAGFTFTNLAALKTIYGNMNNNNRTTLRSAGASSGYAPTGGSLKFKLRGIWVTSGTACNLAPMYADNDLGINSGTSPTNPIYMFGTASADFLQSPGNVDRNYNVIWDIPNAKFPAMDGTTGGGGGGGGGGDSSFIMYGYEEA